MDAVTQTENLIKEVERLKSENETLFKTVLQMKQTLDRLIIKYIENGKQESVRKKRRMVQNRNSAGKLGNYDTKKKNPGIGC